VTLFGTHFARDNRFGVVPMILLSMMVTILLMLFLAWELSSELVYTSTVTPIYPEQVVDSATSPVTTTGR
jgi:hypothetical protein